MTPPLSVVIPTHNRPDLLRQAVASVFNFCPSGSEIIVVADGAREDFVSRPPSARCDLTVIRHARRRGFCAAANAGLRASRAEFVQMLNDDAEVTAGWAEPALAAFQDPRVAAVAPLVLRWPGDVIDSAGDGYDVGGFAYPIGRGRRPAGEFLIPRDVDGASGCSAFFRRSAALAAGGFAESFGAYFEDVDLCCRLRRAGGVIRCVPLSRVLHRGSASYGRPRGRLLERHSCNEERLFWRNTAGRPGELARHAAVLAGKALRRMGEGTLTPWLFGRLRAWSEKTMGHG